jgi:EAL domain-containing protein (putative c-di-GMP-specific phosphodiesterase class I)
MRSMRDHQNVDTPNATARRRRRHVRSCECRALEHALGAGELELYYQPIVDMSRELVVGLEALVRWRRPGIGVLPASAFIPNAEQCGLIARLDDWVIDGAARQIAEWQDDVLIAPGFRVAVNVSGRDFADASLPRKISTVLHQHGADPRCLTIELTESVDVTDLTNAHHTVRALQQLGVEVALDDFGAAYATFQRLRFLPFDELKLDREVMVGASTPVGTAFVRAMVELGQDLSMRVVAEGIETHDQARHARGLGCIHAQGYLWSAPLPAGDVTRRLQSGWAAAGSALGCHTGEPAR